MNALQLWTKASETRLGQWWQLKSAPGRRRMDLALYRMSGGRLTLLSGLLPCLMLTTTGRRSGRQYTTPVVYTREAGEVIVVASKDGTPGDPQWLLNLRVKPVAELSIRGARAAYAARILDPNDEGWEALWSLALERNPTYAVYRRSKGHPISVVAFRPIAAARVGGEEPPG